MSLGLDQVVPGTGGAQVVPPIGEQKRMARTVRGLGILALILALVGMWVPVIGFLMLLAAAYISRRALKNSLDYLVPDEDERYARWASSISVVLLIFSAIGTVLFILSVL
jgi:hypothetical protein